MLENKKNAKNWFSVSDEWWVVLWEKKRNLVFFCLKKQERKKKNKKTLSVCRGWAFLMKDLDKLLLYGISQVYIINSSHCMVH